jgi:hypothetical protein
MNKKNTKELVVNLILKQCDKMNSFINDPQQKIYTVPRRE